MEVLFVSYKYPPSIGGMQKQSYELITGFAAVHKVHSLIYDQRGSLVWFFVSLFWKLPQLLLKHRSIALIHFNDGVCAIVCSWVRLITSKSMAVTYHGLDLVFPNAIYQKILLRWIRSFDCIIAVSTATRDEAIKRGFDVEKVFVIHNGVAVRQKEEAIPIDNEYTQLIAALRQDNKKILVSIGRTVARKGFHWFAEDVLPALDDDTVFVLIGPYPEYGKTKEWLITKSPRWFRDQLVLFFGLSTQHLKLRKLGAASDRFYWLTEVDNVTKDHILNKSDLFVMPNIKVTGDMEGFGLVALEANLQGTYVLAADLEGIRDAVTDGQNGRLIGSGRADLWVSEIKQLLESSTDVETLVEPIRTHLELNFPWEKMVDNYAKVFQKIIDKSKATELRPPVEAHLN